MRISKHVVDKLSKGEVAWDSEVRGFGVRRLASGLCIYVLKYRTIGGRQRWYTIGKHGSPFTADAARTEAKRLLGEIVGGKDPAAERQEKRTGLTVNDLADRYMNMHARAKKKPRSADMDDMNLRNHVRPALGKLPITDVAKRDIVKLHSDMSKTPGAANRCLALLSKMFALAQEWGLRPEDSNPCRHVDKYPEKPRQRYLAQDELKRLGEALLKAQEMKTEPEYILALYWLLILTGARLSEIATAKWSDYDEKNGLLRLGDSKTGAKVIVLGARARELLGRLPRIEKNPYVLPGRKEGSHVVGVQKPWQRIRAAAKLPDVRIHDLRHSFASVAAIDGHSLIVIGAALGHKHASTTSRYAHISNDPVKVAVERTSEAIANAMLLPASRVPQSEEVRQRSAA